MKFVKRDLITDNNHGLQDYSLMVSLHDILKTNKVIPQTVSVPEFYNDISFELTPDDKFNKTKIKKLGDSLIVKHSFADSNLSTEAAINGVNLMIVQNDCDGSTVEPYFNKNKKSNPAAVLYYDGERYYPVYKIKDGNYSGMFNMDRKFIKNILG